MATFNKQKHITYWLRCLKTFLPHQYTAMDTNRLMLAFFTLSALDILDALNSSTTPEERAAHADWVYSLQHPDGGFLGAPALCLSQGDARDHDAGADAVRPQWDAASLPATYFALATLLVLRDDFARVRRTECLRWLSRMQRSDGSFGQTLAPDGTIDGGRDTRFGYVAMVVRWMLGADSGSASAEDGPNIDVDALVGSVRRLQTYDGGFSDEPFHEAHGGYTFCAIATLAIVHGFHDGIADLHLLLRWLVARQTLDLDPEADDDEDFTTGSAVGFNGRCNKTGDTCYTFWIGAALKSLGHIDLIDKASATAYLLQETQHFIGGFMKYPGEPPDIYHSYLGLAALGVLEHPDIRPVHPAATISASTVEYLEQHIRPKYS